jgi:hypothetical protein
MADFPERKVNNPAVSGVPDGWNFFIPAGYFLQEADSQGVADKAQILDLFCEMKLSDTEVRTM